ncbi:MAG: Sec-independent protein translocase subunit TatB [Mycobacteriaceae bacterium]|nr:Sec-independent protein translocase subunit TatB [Mycobacteriaceae bacterium]
MFANIGWGEMLLLVVVGLVVLGPERLPGAIRWASGALRQARDYLSGATSQLREELGPEFEDLRAPISELQKLRGMSPRAAVTKHLLDGDDSWLTGNFDRADDKADDKADRASVKPKSAPGPDSAATPPTAAAAAPFDADAT